LTTTKGKASPTAQVGRAGVVQAAAQAQRGFVQDLRADDLDGRAGSRPDSAAVVEGMVVDDLDRLERHGAAHGSTSHKPLPAKCGKAASEATPQSADDLRRILVYNGGRRGRLRE